VNLSTLQQNSQVHAMIVQLATILGRSEHTNCKKTPMTKLLALVLPYGKDLLRQPLLSKFQREPKLPHTSDAGIEPKRFKRCGEIRLVIAATTRKHWEFLYLDTISGFQSGLETNATTETFKQ